MPRITTAAITLLYAAATTAQVTVLPLDTGWVFSEAGTSAWQEAHVPGYVHLDLFCLGKISNPLTGTGEADCRWVEEKEWVHQSFPFDATSISRHRHAVLECEGLDTFADVYLNDSLVISADNAFRPWQATVTGLLKPTFNVLRIVFHPVIKKSAALTARVPHALPGDAARAVVRKPQYQFGWDWGPRLLSCGITGNIRFIGYSDCRLEDVHIRTLAVDSLRAEMEIIAEIQSLQAEEAALAMICHETGQVVRSRHRLHKGLNRVRMTWQIEKPRLWWCNGEGEPFLYHFDLKLSQQGMVHDHREVCTGIRTIALVQEPDATGSSFYFRLNGKRIYARGANYIPVSPFPSENDTAEHQWLMRSCAAAHMNMIRVWGGGIYERNSFYEACDSLGLLVWQDFMFACTMYPGTDAFAASVEAEATAQVKRLRNHPCIALWCGNNEVSEGWQRWGWQDALPHRARARIQRSYNRIFRALLKGIATEFAGVPYHESSPALGRGDNRYLHTGDAHDWWVWHDGKPFSHFDTHVPRFMSEFGFQSFPSEEVMALMMQGETLQRNAPGWVLHQKHPRGFDLIHAYMRDAYPALSPDSIVQYAQLSQLVQAEGIARGIYAQRAAGLRCGGSLYWQLNDTWPAFSWSSIDYNGEWKALHYFVRRAFAPLTCFETNGTVSALCDGECAPQHHVMRYHTQHGADTESATPDTLLPDASWYLLHRFTAGEHSCEWRVFHPSIQWDTLPYAQPVADVRKPREEGYPIHVSSDTFCRYVCLSADIAGHFSDNYFDLDAGEEKVIFFKPRYDGGLPPVVTATTLADLWQTP